MPFLAPIFAGLSAAFGGVVSLLGGVKAVLGILFNVVMALIQMAMAPKPPKPDDIQQVVRQSVPERVVHLGRLRVGGPILFMEIANRTLYMVVYFCDGFVDGFEEWYVDQRLVEPNAKGLVPAKDPYKSGNRSVLYIDSRPGHSTGTVFRALKENFPRFVTDDFRGDGLALGLLSARSVSPNNVAKTYPSGIPVLNTVMRAGRVYDPRTGERAFSENLVLHLLEYLTHPDGAGIPREYIDLDDFAREATFADEVLPTKSGGSVRRYHGSTSWKMTEKIGDVINRLMIPIDGRLFLRPDGKIGLRVGRWEEPTVHITDDHIIEAEIGRLSTPIQEAGEVVIRFTEPTANYAPATSAPWRDEAVIARAIGGIERLSPECYGIQNHNHARRIAKILSARANPEWQGTIVTNLFGMGAWDQRFIRLTYAPLNIVGRSFEVVSIALDEDDLEVAIEIASFDREATEFDPQTEEGEAPVVPDVIDGWDALPVSGFAVQAFRTSAGVRLLLSVEQPYRPGEHKDKKEPRRSWPWGDDPEEESEDDTDILTAFQWAPAGTGLWRSIGEASEAITAEVSGLTVSGLIDVRAQHRGADWSASQWVVIEDVEARDTWAVPAAPRDVRAAVVGPNTVRVSWSTPEDENFAGVRVYRSKDNNAANALRVDTVYGAAGASYSADDEADKGAYYYWVSSINWRGEARDESARVAATPSPITNG